MFGRKKPVWREYNSSVPQPLSTFSQASSAPTSTLTHLATIDRMPDAAREALRAIEDVCREGLDYGRRNQNVNETALRHLQTIQDVEAPNVVAAWLEVPQGTILDSGPEQGRSSDEALCNQLAILNGAAREAHDQALATARTGVSVESVYLRDKYE